MNVMEDENYLVNDSTIGVVNYLLSLYYRTGMKYKFYITKLNRLLTIYKLCTLKYNGECLTRNYDFVINDDGFMGADRNMFPYLNYEYDFGVLKEDRTEIKDEFDIYDCNKNYLSGMFTRIMNKLCYEPGKSIECEFEISEEAKQLIELIFRKFGNYSISELAPTINEIVSGIPIIKRYGRNRILSDDFVKFLNQNQCKFQNNIVFNFVYNFDRLNANKSYNSNYSSGAILQTNAASSNEKNILKRYKNFITKFKKLSYDDRDELLKYLISLSDDEKKEDKNKIFKI